VNAPDRALIAAVQTNCHIADATHAADMTLCIYLLQMREFYRWEQGLPPLQPMAREAVGAWISAREALWDELEGKSFRALPLAGGDVDPFDVAAANAALAPLGLVYGAGYTAPGRASFFLGALESAQPREGVLLRVCGREYARGLSSPPAALQDRTIYLRREALQRWLWEKYEAWTLRRPEGAYRRALDAHGYASAGEQAVGRMVQQQAETLVLHELGEAQAGELLGPDWPAMRQTLGDRRTELFLRAARDLLADCRVTLPALLQRGDAAGLHFWFANFDGLRAELAPQLERAYEAWCAGGGDVALRAAVQRGAAHWQTVCEQALVLYRAQGAAAQPPIRTLLESAASRQA
jgi:hypothetical protein